MGEKQGRPLAPSTADLAVSDAVRLFGWAGSALPEIRLIGCRFVPIVEFDIEAHRRRVAGGDGPQLDTDTLEIWEWPQYAGHAPPSALRLTGALFRARRGWRRALAEARNWRGFGPAAVLVPGHAQVDELCRLEFTLHGVGLVCTDPLADIGGRDGVAPAGVAVLPEQNRAVGAFRRPADRWVEESLYRHALDHGAYPAA